MSKQAQKSSGNCDWLHWPMPDKNGISPRIYPMPETPYFALRITAMLI